MKLKGKITFLINRDQSTIQIMDVESGAQFLEIKLTPENLVAILSRQGHIDCDLEVRGLEKLGKKQEISNIEFKIPEGFSEYDVDRKKLGEYAQSLLTDGWIAEWYFNSQNSFFTKDGVKFARCTTRRWI